MLANDKRSYIPQRKKASFFLSALWGVGKTAIGESVAKKLYRDFIDIDKEIEKEFNMPVREIFNSIGEKKPFGKKRKKV
ncbi:hypothetical protein GCM10020331_026160 [Ectobacillus funiculus]